MEPKDIKVPGRYEVNFEEVFAYYNMRSHMLTDDLYNFFIKQRPRNIVELVLNQHTPLRPPWPWFAFNTYWGYQVWIHADWIISPAKESKSKSSSVNCDCENPVIVEAFVGIAAAGKTYKVCRCCKRERK